MNSVRFPTSMATTLARTHAESRQHARDAIHPLVEAAGRWCNARGRRNRSMIATLSGTRAIAWSKKKPRLRRRFRIVHITHAHVAAVRPADGRASDLALVKTSSNAVDWPPLLTVARHPLAYGCDEKVTHAANVRSQPDSWLAERAKQVTLPSPNHGRFLLH
jgi:hypothetical protein